MNRFLVLTLLWWILLSEVGVAKTLEECFSAALKRSEALQDRLELIVQAEEKYKQSLGAILPQVDGEATYMRLARPDGASSRSFFRDTQYVAKISGTQPIFQGFREFNAMKSAKASGRAYDLDWQQAAITLYRDVAASFYQVVSIENEIRDIEREVKAYQERIADLRARIRIGRSRPSEVLRVEATLANLRAEEADLKGRLLTAREALVFLTDFEREVPLEDVEPYPESIPRLDGFLSLISERPDLRAEQERQEAARRLKFYEQGGHAPYLGLGANVYPVNTDELDDPIRYGLWDVEVKMTLPIFAGGATQAKVREQASRERQAYWTYERVSRRAVEEVKARYQTILSDQDRLEALGRAMEAQKKNYEFQLKDYRLGLVNNLDVLVALAEYLSSIRNLDRFRYEAKLNWIGLETAVAKRPTLPKARSTVIQVKGK